MRARAAFASALLLCLLPGCAQFELYDKDNREIKGFKYYTAKPYVLVSRTGKTGEPLTISQLYLPDIENPVFAKAKPGWLGNSNLKMQFNDSGTLHDFGQEGDNRVADLVNQLGVFAKNIADAQALRAKTGAPEAVSEPEAKEYAPLLDKANKSAHRGLNATLKTKQEREAFLPSTDALAESARDLGSPATTPSRTILTERLQEVLATWKAQTQALQAGKDDDARRGLADATEILRGVIRRLQSAVAADTHFSLYEMYYDEKEKRTKLRAVSFLPE